MEDIKNYWHQWLWRDALTRLITINFLVWLICAFMSLFDINITQYLMLVGIWGELPYRLWTPITYMFAHYDFLHMFVNMMWLLLFGRLFMQMQGGNRLVTLYIYGGLAGALAFMLYHNSMVMIGASAAVFAIIAAVAILYHQWKVNLLLFGEVKIIWIAVVAVILFVLMGTIDQMIAHCAGIAVGAAYGVLKQRGIDITAPFLNGGRINFTPRVKRPFHSGNSAKYPTPEAELDALLAKVSKSGYSSLNPSQRQRLFELSQKTKR